GRGLHRGIHDSERRERAGTAGAGNQGELYAVPLQEPEDFHTHGSLHRHSRRNRSGTGAGYDPARERRNTRIDQHRRADVRRSAVNRIYQRRFTWAWSPRSDRFPVGAGLLAWRLGSILELVVKVNSYFYGCLLGVFLLGIFTERGCARGASI